MAPRQIIVRAPATTANLGPGFDSLGMALDLWAEVALSTEPAPAGFTPRAAARAAGLLGGNALVGEPLDREAILALGTEMEGHPDNMAAVLFGGLQVVVLDGETVVHAGLEAPTGLKAVLFVPEVEMPTDESRRALPTQLSREDAVHNIGRAARLVAALAGNRVEVLGGATRDPPHQPAGARAFPAMEP